MLLQPEVFEARMIIMRVIHSLRDMGLLTVEQIKSLPQSNSRPQVASNMRNTIFYLTVRFFFEDMAMQEVRGFILKVHDGEKSQMMRCL
jgi:hypothetical protein